MNTSKRGFEVRALGEIAIRCNCFDQMAEFYENIIGLKRLKGNHSEGIFFFRIADGIAGHTTVLALFNAELGRDAGSSSTNLPTNAGHASSLHHIALSIPYSEQDAAISWYEKNNIEYQIEIFGWVGWRGVFVKDPDGNTVELVAFNEGLLANV